MAGEVFLKMTENYDSAYVSLVNIPGVGCWIGATPEKLLSYNNGNFKSVALASTRKNGLDCDPEWGQKEIDEQRYVTQYICRILDELNTVYNVSEPKTITAGNIQHLSTDFEGKIETVKLLQLINKLHPTPAVCGSPLKEAKKLINKTETHDRSYYSGFLGYVENSKNLDFFVNLRCARLRDKDCIIYVGGGVTAESDPEKEWEETKEKSQTILNLL